jgi:hypothetical protein
MEGILAPTINQWLTYWVWFQVYAKSRCQLPEHMAELTNLYIVSGFFSGVSLCAIFSEFFQETMEKLSQGEPWVCSTAPLYDVFEPTFIQCVLEQVVNLGHLVFGRDGWKSMGSYVSKAQDPLTLYFQK